MNTKQQLTQLTEQGTEVAVRLHCGSSNFTVRGKLKGTWVGNEECFFC